MQEEEKKSKGESQATSNDGDLLRRSDSISEDREGKATVMRDMGNEREKEELERERSGRVNSVRAKGRVIQGGVPKQRRKNRSSTILLYFGTAAATTDSVVAVVAVTVGADAADAVDRTCPPTNPLTAAAAAPAATTTGPAAAALTKLSE